ncbi:FG-GAP-like repeat-containing protein [Gracilimonas sp.]|uniref:FG-GAP-like repeat-containing protein n=1 Tax=Gracilimonas sp. TaxID=1974203 RepID=UPI0028711EC8|nr:FG-GAP-like repeat-containing protein [Gracilimonas sp.]
MEPRTLPYVRFIGMLILYVGLGLSQHTLAQVTVTDVTPLHGASGAEITIYGSGFDGTAANNVVSFSPVGGGAATTANATSVTGTTKLTVNVPAGLVGNYEISVENTVTTDTGTYANLFAGTFIGGWYGEPTTSQNQITSSIDNPLATHIADLDGDGDMDVLSASFNDGKLAWYENTDEQGTFGVQNIIASDYNSPRHVSTGDIDGDGDLDVLMADFGRSGTLDGRAFYWHENTDGAGTFGPKQLIFFDGSITSMTIFPADIDGDGDLDVVTSSNRTAGLRVFENTNGQGAFGPEQLIDNAGRYARSRTG